MHLSRVSVFCESRLLEWALVANKGCGGTKEPLANISQLYQLYQLHQLYLSNISQLYQLYLSNISQLYQLYLANISQLYQLYQLYLSNLSQLYQTLNNLHLIGSSSHTNSKGWQGTKDLLAKGRHPN